MVKKVLVSQWCNIFLVINCSQLNQFLSLPKGLRWEEEALAKLHCVHWEEIFNVSALVANILAHTWIRLQWSSRINSTCHHCKTKTSQLLLDVWSSCVVWVERIEHLSNCTVGTQMVFLRCECEGGFSDLLLGWMNSRTLYTDVTSLHCGWADVC